MFKRIKTGFIDWALREERYNEQVDALLASLLADEMDYASSDMTALEYAQRHQILDKVDKKRALVCLAEERERAIAWAIKEEAHARANPTPSYTPSSSYASYARRRRGYSRGSSTSSYSPSSASSYSPSTSMNLVMSSAFGSTTFS